MTVDAWFQLSLLRTCIPSQNTVLSMVCFQIIVPSPELFHYLKMENVMNQQIIVLFQSYPVFLIFEKIIYSRFVSFLNKRNVIQKT